MMSEKIKLLRERSGWTQAELARRLVTTRSSVNAWESGISIPSTQYIVELSRLFHVSTDYLFGLRQNQTLDVSGLPPEQAVRIIRKNGAENVLLGSDSPWATTAHALRYLLNLPLTDREKEMIMGENAARILGLLP